jgi:hypothetical protein
MHTLSHICIHTHAHAHAYTLLTCTQTYIWHTYTSIHTYIHTYIYTYTGYWHTYCIHTYIHAYIHLLVATQLTSRWQTNWSRLNKNNQNGVTMPVLKTMVVDLLARKNREPDPLGHCFSSLRGRKTLKDTDYDVTFAAANCKSSARAASSDWWWDGNLGHVWPDEIISRGRSCTYIIHT